MAAKPKPISQLKQILRLTQQGKSIKFITRNLSLSSNTVRKYLSLQKASRHIHKVPLLIATLGHSQYSYVEGIRSQKTENLLGGLRRGFSFFGGVTKALIPDNMKTAVVKTHEVMTFAL